MGEKWERKAEKRKREETGENIDPHITKGSNNESVEYITDDDRIGIYETDEDLIFFEKDTEQQSYTKCRRGAVRTQ